MPFPLRRLWDEDQKAYASYRSGAATALKRHDAKVFASSVAEWDSSLRSIEGNLQALKVSPTTNAKLKDLLDGSTKEFAGAVARERRIAQSVLVRYGPRVGKERFGSTSNALQ